MLRFLKQCDGQSVDPVVPGMRSDEFNEYDAPAEIESNDHPKIAASDFKPRAFPVQDFCIRSADHGIVKCIMTYGLRRFTRNDELPFSDATN
jgi:hypothetical protein